MPAGPVTTHLAGLVAAGWSLRAVADAAHVGPTTVHKIAQGAPGRVRADTGRRLLAVLDDAVLSRPNGLGFVRRVGTTRRIQGLLAIGHRHGDITAAMHDANPGVRTSSQLLLSQSGGWVTRATHDAVVAAFDRLAMTPGVSARTRARAGAAGFLPPLAWDDDTIDELPYLGINKNDAQITNALHSGVDAPEPPAFIDEIAVEQAMGGRSVHLILAERTVAIARLTAWGLSAAEIAQRLHLSTRTVQRGQARARAA
jgi:transcriptional regulator with XRE-family HTH domain/AraC-like DNA-binding protein